MFITHYGNRTPMPHETPFECQNHIMIYCPESTEAFRAQIPGDNDSITFAPLNDELAVVALRGKRHITHLPLDTPKYTPS